MKIKKNKICDLPGVYVTSTFNSVEGKQYLICASENKGEGVFLIDRKTLSTTNLWTEPTGVMNIIQYPNQNRLAAITKFYPIFQSKDAHVNDVIPSANGLLNEWTLNEVLPLPFCHRIGFFQGKNETFLVACTLCENKDFQEDWSKPGAVYVCQIPKTIDKAWKYEKIYCGLTKNHGLYIFENSHVYITAEEGILLFDFSEFVFGCTCEPKIISTIPTGDIMVSDIDNDGLFEFCCIEPFHGNILSLYKYQKEGNVKKLFSIDIDFGHVCWLGKIYLNPAIIVGNRGGNKSLDMYICEGDIGDIAAWKKNVLDSGVGPTQITVYKDNGKVNVLSANHGLGEVAVYELIL